MKTEKRLMTWVLVVALFHSLTAVAQTLAGQPLVEALQQGGLVIVMRHASSPRELPDAAIANADNVNRERQLDAQGRADARALGEVLRTSQIPVAEVISSPTYRALETARLAGFTDVTSDVLLSNEGMQNSSAAHAARLHALVGEEVAGGNRLVITHGPNMEAAFGNEAEGIGEGDALILAPGQESYRVVGRMLMSDWKALSGN